MEMHQYQHSAWGLPCPMPREGTGGQRRDLAGAVMEPGTISSSQPGTMGSLMKRALGWGSLAGGSQQGGGSRLCSSPPRQHPWLGKSKQAVGKPGVLPAAVWGWQDP